MPVYTNATAEPRDDLAAVVVHGQGLNENNIWEQVLPPHPVTNKTGSLINLTLAQRNAMRIMDKIMRPGTNLERVNLTVGSQPFAIDLRGEEIQIPDETEMTYSEYFSLEAMAAQMGTDKLELTHEYLTAAAMFSTATFGAATNSLVAYTVANLATISFIPDVIAAVLRGRGKGERYDSIIVPFIVLARVMQSPAVLAWVRGTLGPQSEVNETTILAALREWGITKLFVGESMYNAAPDGAEPILTEIWPATYIWVGKTGNGPNAEGIAAEQIQGVGASLYWEKFGMDNVDTYRDEPRRSNIVRSTTSLIPYIANARAGTLIATQFA